MSGQFTGHSVIMHFPGDDSGNVPSIFPVVTIGGLATELASILRSAGLGLTTEIVTDQYGADYREKAEQDTERLKSRIIAARATDNAGLAFLNGLGYNFKEPVKTQ